MKNVAILISILVIAPSGYADDTLNPVGSRGWQERRLFQPSDADLNAETRGRVVIYDGMEQRDVERAMDQQFHRVEHMMFIRTKTVDEAGEVVYEDDDC